MDNDFYDGFSERTKEALQKAQQYVDLAIKNGDVAIQEKAGEIIIKVRVKKEKPNVQK